MPVVYVTFVQRGLSFRDGNFIELESTVTHIYFLNLFTILNPYKPSVLLWDICKQCRPGSDDAERRLIRDSAVWLHNIFYNLNKMIKKNNHRTFLKW